MEKDLNAEDLKNHLDDLNGIFIRSSIPLNASLLSQFRIFKVYCKTWSWVRKY